jgi:hypothetical protein
MYAVRAHVYIPALVGRSLVTHIALTNKHNRLNMLVDDKQSHNVHFSSAAAVQAALATIEEERKLTFRQAFRMYWRAALWSAGLSAALIMEGYDVGIVSLARLTLLVSSYGHSTDFDSD